MLFLSTTDDFLRDDDFIRYVLDDDGPGHDHWSYYRDHAPEHVQRAFHRACDILLHLDDCTLLTPIQRRRLKQRVCRTLRIKNEE